MSIETRIYAGGAFAFGGQTAVDDLIAARYSAVIVWSVHVQPDGTLVLNDTQIVADGVYAEAQPMNLPARVAQLRKSGIQVIFSVGAGGTHDFTNIGKLLDGGVPGPDNILYRNFAALKAAMAKAGGDVDAIDFDNEDNMDTAVMVNFGSMLASVSYASVTLCPYYQSPVWTDTYKQLLAGQGKGYVSAIHLQCYSGGQGNSPEPWGEMIASAGGDTLLIPGLATVQAGPGPWWYNGAQGSSVVKTADVAMYGGADWSGLLRKANYPSADVAMQAAMGGETFFFYCRGPLYLGPDKSFQTGDAVYFTGEPHWGSAPQCDGYALSGGCTDIYNGFGACPADLAKQYARWKTQSHPPQGGFIWLYDSVLNCLLSGCCGGSESQPATTAADYRNAIVDGLS